MAGILIPGYWDLKAMLFPLHCLGCSLSFMLTKLPKLPKCGSEHAVEGILTLGPRLPETFEGAPGFLLGE